MSKGKKVDYEGLAKLKKKKAKQLKSGEIVKKTSNARKT